MKKEASHCPSTYMLPPKARCECILLMLNLIVMGAPLKIRQASARCMPAQLQV